MLAGEGVEGGAGGVEVEVDQAGDGGGAEEGGGDVEEGEVAGGEGEGGEGEPVGGDVGG